jgi:hypothetical protein
MEQHFEKCDRDSFECLKHDINARGVPTCCELRTTDSRLQMISK